MVRIGKYSALSLLAVSILVGSERSSHATCIQVFSPPDFTVNCTGDGATSFHATLAAPPSINVTFNVFDITSDIPGDSSNVGGLFFKPAIGLLHLGVGIGEAGSLTFNTGAFGIRSEGHGLAYLAVGVNGKDGEDRRGTGEDGNPGAQAPTASIDIQSGFVSSQFASNTPNASAPSAAILLQSLGGRGGNGGKGTQLAFNKSRGGHGGKGGDGNSVFFSTGDAAILITGVRASGLRIESIAGDGGKGGDATSFGGGSIGGNGGQGGSGGAVVVDMDTNMSIAGNNHAIVARSYGGAGGDGGKASSTFGSGNGGSGAGAGPGGPVTVTVGGQIKTQSTVSIGLIAQSIGGFAGDAGRAKGFVGFGASSESAGDGGRVTVTLKEGLKIDNKAREAGGVLVQSIGGGGGLGSKASGLVALGGSGSAGGHGGAVVVNSFGQSIKTGGLDSPALSVSSIGGGGGDAGGSRGVVSIGNRSGTGGNGGSVSVTNTARLVTQMEQSDGLVAQSIGSGGGSAHATNGVIALGGSGARGGNGGAVTVTNSGSVNTAGDFADAIYMQSIGGGGGEGSYARGIGVGVSVAYGGVGGQGGNGNTVTYKDNGANDYTLTTAGDNARGIFAQSLGGGGGDGGGAVTINPVGVLGFSFGLGNAGNGSQAGNAGVVSVNTGADITTAGKTSGALVAQSLGGGGGNGGSAVTVNGPSIAFNSNVALGGGGAKGGSGSTVTVESRGTLKTSGLLSDGILAQSVGGGGGNAGTILSVNSSSLLNVNVNLGGFSGAGGSGGKVDVDSKGSVDTQADGSRALVAQSVGGGGGSSGNVVAVNGIALGNLNLAFGGRGGTGGNGGVVEVEASGGLSTSGNSATALLAQSVGGGGGSGSVVITDNIAGLGNIGVALGGSGSSSGDGKAVTVVSSGPISTAGENSGGVLAQSISRSGGQGGFTFSGSQVSTAAINIGVGGSGGAGGQSGLVTLSNAGSVDTQGTASTALLAQSVGGGGGQGGGTVAAGGLSIGRVSVNVGVAAGGAGGSGGKSGNVTLINDGALSTQGEQALGILAQSIGGSGGSGGFAATGGLTVGLLTADVQVAVGGSGGNGGQAGEVRVDNGGAITTEDFESIGLLAQSIGGSGGNGGNALSVSATASSGTPLIPSSEVLVDVGGKGGGGAVAQSTTVTNTGAITTLGHHAEAILAQSIGGNGGNGGGASSFHLRLTRNDPSQFVPDTAFRVATSVGGGGGSGMEAGTVLVDNMGALSTLGAESAGIYAQSVGGGGGSGGSAFTGVLDYQAVPSSSLPTHPINELKVETNVGGSGGAAGNAKAVTVMNTNGGNILTEGVSSPGIFAQSVGGGGGDGGAATNSSLFLTGTCRFAVSQKLFDCFYQPFNEPVRQQLRMVYSANINIGGGGGASGNGGVVTVENSADIMTEGDFSSAIFAQSVGGGGGIGGNGNPGIDAITDNQAAQAIESLLGLLEEDGFIHQFKAWSELAVSIGGAGGASGDGRAVIVRNSGVLTTSGEDSYGIEAQSVGGGGGQGGKGATPFLLNFALGGTGSGGGDGGVLTIDNDGSIVTTGNQATGIFAQSVGGGGGQGGDVMQAFSFPGFDINMGVGFTGIGAGQVPPKPGVGGNGGGITLQSGQIITSGQAAHGIFAQSIGGSGGIVVVTGIDSPGPIPDATTTYSGSGNDVGNGGDILIAVDDRIAVSGEAAHGVIAQSAGGKGSSGGNVTIEATGDIYAGGKNGRAILAHSEGKSANGNIVIEVAPQATVSTEAEARATILLLDGAENRIVNRGIIEKRGSGASDEDFVVQTIGGSLHLENYGLLHGQISLDDEPGPRAGTNLIHNKPGGRIELGPNTYLGKGGILRNEGIMSAGEIGKIAKADIRSPTGRVGQDPGSNGTGVLHVDHQIGDTVTVAPDSDLITIRTDATLRGSVVPNLVGVNVAPSGTTGEIRILQLKNNQTIIQSLKVEDTAAVNYQLKDITHNGEPAVTLAYEVNLEPWNGFSNSASQSTAESTAESTTTKPVTKGTAPVEVPENVNHLTEYLEVLIGSRIAELQAIDAGELKPADSIYAFVGNLETLFLNIDSVESLLDSYEATVPSAHTAPIDASLNASIEFADALQACRQRSEQGTTSIVADNSCAWVRLSGSALQRDGDANTSGYTESAFGFAGGAETEIADGLTVGLAGSFERLWLSADNLHDSTGNRFQGGAFLSQQVDQWNFSTSLSGGTSGYDLNRAVETPSGVQSASSEPRTTFVAGHARVSRNFNFGPWSLEPTFDGGLYHLWRPGYDESGAEPFGIRFDDFQETLGTLNPFLQVDIDSNISGTPIRLYGRAGVLGIVGGSDRSFTATFAGVPDGGPSFELEDDADSVFADLGLGLDITLAPNMSVNLVANTLLSGNTRAYGGSVRFNLEF